ncbi:MAG: DNA alkylation repair protein [Chlorobiaceae bacterium]
MTAADIRSILEASGSARAALFALRFFKTGPGQYGEGDRFRGIRVPVLRKLAPSLDGVQMEELLHLLASEFHEDRLLALLMLMRRYARGDEQLRGEIYRIYLDNTRFINNWDLVDVTAGHIVGKHLRHRDRTPLYTLARSESLWERRIAIVATFHFIRNGEFSDTMLLAEQLLRDPEELIHKATGWMLREVGKREQGALEAFLLRHCRTMPRVMLRYAIERLPEAQRQLYLKGELGS